MKHNTKLQNTGLYGRRVFFKLNIKKIELNKEPLQPKLGLTNLTQTTAQTLTRLEFPGSGLRYLSSGLFRSIPPHLEKIQVSPSLRV